jgi:hypothetical protein
MLLQGKLVTVGEDGDGLRNLYIKGWAVEGLRPGATPPILAAPGRLLPTPPKPASGSIEGSSEGRLAAVALHCSEWPTVHAALGLSSGAVHMLRCDVAKGKVAAPVPAAALRDGGGGGGGVTGLHFVVGSEGASMADGSAVEQLHLFAVGASRMAAYDPRTGRRLLEEECGAAAGCSAVSSRGELMLACPDAIYSYTGGQWVVGGCSRSRIRAAGDLSRRRMSAGRPPWHKLPDLQRCCQFQRLCQAKDVHPAVEEGRKAAFAVRGEKLAAAATRHYLLVVLADEAGGGGAAPGTQVSALLPRPADSDAYLMLPGDVRPLTSPPLLPAHAHPHIHDLHASLSSWHRRRRYSCTICRTRCWRPRPPCSHLCAGSRRPQAAASTSVRRQLACDAGAGPSSMSLPAATLRWATLRCQTKTGACRCKHTCRSSASSHSQPPGPRPAALPPPHPPMCSGRQRRRDPPGGEGVQREAGGAVQEPRVPAGSGGGGDGAGELLRTPCFTRVPTGNGMQCGVEGPRGCYHPACTSVSPPLPPPLLLPQADAATLASIRRHYGDFLYAKRDYDQAMEQ